MAIFTAIAVPAPKGIGVVILDATPPEVNVYPGCSATPFFTLGFSPPTISISASATDSTHIRVTFSVPLLYKNVLTCLENYVITPPMGAREIEVHQAVPEDVTNPTYVDLTVDEMLDGGNYLVDVENIEAA